MRVLPISLDNGYDVRGPKATRAGKESARTAVPVIRQSTEGIRLCRSYTSLAGACLLCCTDADDRGDPPITIG